MSGFDEFCKKHELNRNLDYIELAWDTQQKEIDDLNNWLLMLQNRIDELEKENLLLKGLVKIAHSNGEKMREYCEKSDKLQKRINEAMRLIKTRQHNADVTNVIFHMDKILKGEQK